MVDSERVWAVVRSEAGAARIDGRKEVKKKRKVLKRNKGLKNCIAERISEED